MSRISLFELGPGNPNCWVTFKEHVASLIIEALLLLRRQNDLTRDEKDLNRLLFLCIQIANLNFGLPLPAYDAHNPPDPEDKQKAKREDNLPDFYWTLMDHEANDDRCSRTFVLECKRLDKKKESSTWVYTEQYVIEGILRFFLDEKGYGKGCDMGAMAGYIQDIEFDQVLKEINSHLATHGHSIPLLAMPTDGWQQQEVSLFNHSFNHTYIPIYFSLKHFWLDMRDCHYIEQKPTLPRSVKKTKQKTGSNKKRKMDVEN